MSLTRKEWEDMWLDIEAIGRYNDYLFIYKPKIYQKAQKHINNIKDKIESVIGQQE